MLTYDLLFAKGYFLEVHVDKEIHFDRLLVEIGGSVVVLLRKGVEVPEKDLLTKIQSSRLSWSR